MTTPLKHNSVINVPHNFGADEHELLMYNGTNYISKTSIQLS